MIWYVPLGLPGDRNDWGLDSEYETEDIYSNGLFGIPASRFPIRTDITDYRIYLTYENTRTRVHKVVVQNMEGELDLLAILADEPPPVGWWMPTLRSWS